MQIFDSRGQLKESVARFFRAKGSAPRLILEDVNADADERLWDWQASNGQLALRTCTDADESGASPIVISRQGTTVTAISLAAGALTFNGTPLVLQSRQIMAGTGLTGGGDLSADRTISLSASTISAVNLAMSAVQPGDLANVAFSGDYADLLNTPTIPPDLSALQFLTAVDESTALPNSRMLVAGSNITFDTSTPGQLTIHATGSGGGGAVNAVIGGTGISVDNTDPTEPVVSLSADSQSALALATTAVQPEDLALVAFSGEYSDLSGIPSTFAPSAHTHDAADIVSGTLADERLSSNIPRLNASALVTGAWTWDSNNGGAGLFVRRSSGNPDQFIQLWGDANGNWITSYSPTTATKHLILRVTTDAAGTPGSLEPGIGLQGRAGVSVGWFSDNIIVLNSARIDLTATNIFANGTNIRDAALFTVGTLGDGRLSANIPRLNAANTFSAVQTVQVSGATPLSIRRVGSSQSVSLEFRHDGATRYLGLDVSGNLRVGASTNLSVSGTKLVLDDDPRLSDARTPIAHTHLWADITDKPTTFTPSAHSHGDEDITGLSWAKLSGVPVYATRWPSWDEVTGKPSSFTPSAHTHSAADITSGTLADARLSANIPRLNAANTFTAAQAIQISTNTPLAVRRTGSSQNVNIEFQHDSATRYLGIDASGNLRFGETANLSGSGVRVSLEGHTHSGEAITSGTIADARLPTVMSGKRFSSVVIFEGAADGSVFHQYRAAAALGITGTLDAWLETDGFGLTTSPIVRFRRSGTNPGLEGVVFTQFDLASTAIYLLPAQGLAVGNPTGGLMGAGSVNANALYQNGIAVSLEGHTHSEYLKSNYPSGNVTISSSAPSGGSDGDIWLQVL